MINRTEQEIMQNWKGEIDKPVVSVCTITYNHEKYITETIDSFLMQETDFPFEVVIGEDCSTDATRNIIVEYIRNYSNIIKLITSDQNVGMQENFKRTMEACRGKYIALCEGDDYWTDVKKLRVQKDFLEKNANYGMSYHRVNIEKEGSFFSDSKDITEIRYNKIENKISLDVYTLLNHGNFIHTASVVLKRELVRDLPTEFIYSTVGDYFLYIIITYKGGLIHKLDDRMAVYRRGVGIYSSLDSITMNFSILTYMTCILSFLDDKRMKQIFLKRTLAHINNLKFNYFGDITRAPFLYKSKSKLIRIWRKYFHNNSCI